MTMTNTIMFTLPPVHGSTRGRGKRATTSTSTNLNSSFFRAVGVVTIAALWCAVVLLLSVSVVSADHNSVNVDNPTCGQGETLHQEGGECIANIDIDMEESVATPVMMVSEEEEEDEEEQESPPLVPCADLLEDESECTSRKAAGECEAEEMLAHCPASCGVCALLDQT
jgi:hypothetical protein